MQVSIFVYLRPFCRKIELVNLLFHFPYCHMTRTAPRAISLENHKKKSSRVRAVRVEVIGPEKRVRPY